MNEMFTELKATKPAWRASFAEGSAEEDEIKRQYVKCFLENGINDWALVELGLTVARRTPGDFFPASGTFLAWCKGDKKHHEHIAIERSTIEHNENMKRLEKPQNKEVGNKAINEIKKMWEKTE